MELNRTQSQVQSIRWFCIYYSLPHRFGCKITNLLYWLVLILYITIDYGNISQDSTYLPIFGTISKSNHKPNPKFNFKSETKNPHGEISRDFRQEFSNAIELIKLNAKVRKFNNIDTVSINVSLTEIICSEQNWQNAKAATKGKKEFEIESEPMRDRLKNKRCREWERERDVERDWDWERSGLSWIKKSIDTVNVLLFFFCYFFILCNKFQKEKKFHWNIFKYSPYYFFFQIVFIFIFFVRVFHLLHFYLIFFFFEYEMFKLIFVW